MFESEEVELTFTDGALKEIAASAFHINEEMENIGARRLSTVMSKVLNEFLYDIPEVIGPNARISITYEMLTRN